MKRVYLITGAAGHLAQTTIERLRGRDCLIRGLILPGEPGRDDEIVTYYEGDVTKPDTLDPFFSGLEGQEVIVLHMAALISIQDTNPSAIYEVNVNGTRNVLEKCRQIRPARFLYVSSVHAIPVPASNETIREVRSFSAQAVEGAYARTKAEATQLVLDAGKQGMDVVVVHPSGIIGPGDAGRNHISQLLLMYLNRRLPMGVQGGYDLVDVRDVADGIVAAADRGRSRECYLLTNRYVSIPELLDYARIAAGRRVRKISCPLWVAKLVTPLAGSFAALTGSRAIFTDYALETIGSFCSFSHEKATKELQYHPRDMKETVSDTVDYLQHVIRKT